MADLMSEKSLRSIPELKYVNAENVIRYRAIMRFIYQEYKRLRYWLKPEDVHTAIIAEEIVEEYTLEQCSSDLEQLTEWGNLTSRHDGGRSATLEEYLKKKMQYLLRPYSIEIERLLESLEKVTGYGGSLEPTLFDDIAEKLFKIREEAGEYESKSAHELWKALYESFVKLHENAADYIASLHTAKAEEMMVTDSFMIFKDKLTDYLRNFVQALQRSAYKIEGNLSRISNHNRDAFLDKVAEGELSKPSLEELPSKEEILKELHQGWDNLNRWFLGIGETPSELTMLERVTKDAIARMVRSVIRIQERKRSGLSRRKELEHLAQWFSRTESLDTSHRLAAYVFGLFPTRHLQGEDYRESDRADHSMWEEVPNIRSLRSRSRKRGGRQQTEAVKDNGERKRKEKEAFMRRQQEESKRVVRLTENGDLRISEMKEVTVEVRILLLQWIGRCHMSKNHIFDTADGIRVQLINAQTSERTVLKSEDGELELPNYEFVFSQHRKGVREHEPDDIESRPF